MASVVAARKRAILSLLEGCKRSTRELKQIHAQMTTTSLLRDILLLSRLLDLYADVDIHYANSLFSRIHRPTVFIWNSMIRAHSCHDRPQLALALYKGMLVRGRSTDHFTFPFVLKACAAVSDHRFGGCVHGRVLRTGHELNLYVSSSLMHMYVSCGDVGSAEVLFEKITDRNVVVWTTMISGFVHSGRADEAIRLVREMGRAGVEPNEITLVHVLAACAQARDLETGRWVHAQLNKSGNRWIQSNVVLATALLDMYGRCGGLKIARNLFDRMLHKNEVSWNAMISTYNQYERYAEVLELFEEMTAAGVKPDKVTMLGLLGACTGSGVWKLGRGIHAYIEKTSSSKDMAVSTSLMDMYAKTGDTQNAIKIFRDMETRDVCVWTSMIIGLAMDGRGMEAISLFKEMQEDGIVPDHITFIGVLTACSHAGLVDEGREHFSSMRNIYGIEPSVEHYGCMIDLLCRSGYLMEAERLVETMPVQPSLEIWGAFLSGCEIHSNVELAELAGKKMAEFDPVSSGVHVLLSNIYAGAGRWEGVEKAREMMWYKGIGKTHGLSSIEASIIDV